MTNVIPFPIPQRDREEAFESYRDLLDEHIQINSLVRIQSNEDLRCDILKLARLTNRRDEVRKLMDDEYPYFMTQRSLTTGHGKRDLIDTLRMIQEQAEKRLGQTIIHADGVAAPFLAEALNYPTDELDGRTGLKLTVQGQLQTPDVYWKQLESEWMFTPTMQRAYDEPFEKMLERTRKDAE